MGRWHLKSNPKRKNGKEYKYYEVAENYIDKEGKHQKKRIKYLGNLSDEKIEPLRLALKIFNGDNLVFALLDKIKYVESKKYLDVAILSHIYDALGLNRVFDIESNKELGTKEVAKILTLSRCLDPQANYRTVDWLKDSYLPEIMKIDPERYNKDKIFRELSNISDCRVLLQKHFAKLSREFKDGDDIDIYFLDATTSYFEGIRCDLADSAKDKTTGYQDKVILIFLVTDKKGYPVMWDVFGGKARETVEFKSIAIKMCHELGIKEVTFCFDRGMASKSNYNLIESIDLKSKFITGLDKDQIETVFDLESFVKNTRPKLIKKFKEEISERQAAGKKKFIKPVNGFYRLGKDRFYKDLGVMNGKRYVVSFNINIYEKMKTDRLNMIQSTCNTIDKINTEYHAAKKDRDDVPLENIITTAISKYRLKKIITYEVKPVKIKNKKDFVQSYEVKYSINDKELHEEEKHDGILIYITNHTEKLDDMYFNVSAGQIVQHYKNKYLIENAFRHLKSFADLRPFYVWLTEHVKAHVDICMIAYFINTHIYHRLSEAEISLDRFYSLIKSFSRVCRLDTGTGRPVTLLKTLSKEMNQVLKLLGASSVAHKSNLESLNIKMN
ncbi:MAG: IS1634 family transposase [Deltaproteobacteria bacterium]|nr:IS1634 family transposase [Deltaproteobacteria bacterium]